MLSITSYSSLSISGSPKKRSVRSDPLRNSANSSSCQVSVSSCLCFLHVFYIVLKTLQTMFLSFLGRTIWGLLQFGYGMATVSFRDWSSVKASKLRVRMKHRKHKLSSHCDMVLHPTQKAKRRKNKQVCQGHRKRSIMSQFLAPQKWTAGRTQVQEWPTINTKSQHNFDIQTCMWPDIWSIRKPCPTPRRAFPFHYFLLPTYHKMITNCCSFAQSHKAIKAEHATKPNYKVVHFLSPE